MGCIGLPSSLTAFPSATRTSMPHPAEQRWQVDATIFSSEAVCILVATSVAACADMTFFNAPKTAVEPAAAAPIFRKSRREIFRVINYLRRFGEKIAPCSRARAAQADIPLGE